MTSVQAHPLPPVLMLAAPDPDGLAELLAAPDATLLAAAGTGGPDPLPGGSPDGCRLGIVDPTPKSLALARKLAAKGQPWRGRSGVWFSPQPLLADPRAGTAFVFPGLEADFAPQVDDVAGWLGVPPPLLSAASLASHAAGVLAVGQLLEEALRALGINPQAIAGHSVGEWNAMRAGGIMAAPELDAMLVRGLLDGLEVPEVDFAVVGCSVSDVNDVIAREPRVVVSHENSTNQTVVCGPAEALTDILATFQARGVMCQTLPFRSGFHTPMLAPYLSQFHESLQALGLRPAVVPVWSASSMEPFPPDEGAIRSLFLRHLVEPVRFRQVVEGLYASGVRVFVQMGAGQLASLVDDTLRGRPHLTVSANSERSPGMTQLCRVAVALWVDGGRPDLAALQAGPPARAGQAAPPRPALPPATAAPAELHPALAAVRRLLDRGTQVPLAAELAALLHEVADSVVSVLDAAEQGGSAPAGPRHPGEPEDSDVTLRISTADMPYLLDHCLAEQAAGWPDETDRRPVVPAATTLWHMMRAAERAVPGTTATGADDVSFDRWVVAAPALDVLIRTERLDAGRVRVRFGDFASAVILVGPTYHPASWQPGPPDPGEQPPATSAADLYDQRWLFHGPAFRVITRCQGVAEHGARGELTVTTAPGALLDGVGQVLGLWLIEREASWIAFPRRISRLRFHAPEPPPGTKVECRTVVRDVVADEIGADAFVTVSGRPLMSISGWQDRRFDGGGRLGDIHRTPQSATLSERQAAGWWLLTDPWRSLTARELSVHKYLAAEERDAYHSCPVRQQRGWLLRRVVAKDAVRGWLWEHGFGPVFPAEIAIVEQDGRVTWRGRHGRVFPPLDLVVDQAGEAAVAAVGEPGTCAPLRMEAADLDLAPLGPSTVWVHNPPGLPERHYLVTHPVAGFEHHQAHEGWKEFSQ